MWIPCVIEEGAILTSLQKTVFTICESGWVVKIYLKYFSKSLVVKKKVLTDTFLMATGEI